ncbi:hypothetical protein G3T14_10660 [Methylobacterium sp. BTF04]|uniref:hypothetical protein n=1 Tax=Methylobacterium sp. BTF04 TaxID=2708300 RepID=UPI0013D8A18B|nr:hypothetical protein [Methylobacterium sp. BTF04]NEU12598.1 hypothetical protein [Methylobacterium sp. BTF04]
MNAPRNMTIWDVIPDPGRAVASLLDPNFPPGPRRIPVPRRLGRTMRLFDAHPDEFPVMEAPVVAEPAPAPLDAMQRLVASGIANEYIATLGALRDPDAPFTPRSIGFPVEIRRVGGMFQPPTAPRIWQLHLSTPACAALPFVRRIEEVTGLKARWDPDFNRGMCGQWHHAVDLANDANWERLASSMEHTTPTAVARSAGIHLGYGSLSVINARRLLSAAGVAEPGTRSCPNIMPSSSSSLTMSLDGWEAVHAIEDGLVIPGNPKRSTFARVTEAGWRSLGKEPPPPPPPKPRKVKFALPAAEVAYVKDAIQAILPKGVPTYVREILYVGRVPRSKSRRLAEIVLWDGGIGRLEISGEPGAHGYRWRTTGGDGRPFHWDEAAKTWARVDEPEAD